MVNFNLYPTVPEYIQMNDGELILFYSPRCSYSIEILKESTGTGMKINPINIDEMEHERIPSGLRGTPTIAEIRNGELVFYEGEYAFKLLKGPVPSGTLKKTKGTPFSRNKSEIIEKYGHVNKDNVSKETMKVNKEKKDDYKEQEREYTQSLEQMNKTYRI